jgi:hypothetical protein
MNNKSRDKIRKTPAAPSTQQASFSKERTNYSILNLMALYDEGVF